ncbi:hypothetical protein BD626DRAFT_632958 [Schizophyllum amplum]|uniref:F-box domain-containing protein n=1 Tax=Schizophyllum amplum TaxID=97359 RepID=A0A550C537_9AGAR|nr:hypothetical protein BD626DRAFT_632958 [Auriculariopsis ampla]
MMPACYLEPPSGPACPIHSLPLELIIKIFTHCSNDTVTSIIKLTHICGRWRAIAFGAPLLWTNLPLLRTQAAKEEHVQLIHEWLHRAAGHPVRLELQSPYHPACRSRWPNYKDSAIPSIMSGLLRMPPSGYREPATAIGQLRLYGTPEEILDVTSVVPAGAFSQLSRLTISCHLVHDGHPPICSPILPFCYSPHLREFVVEALSQLTTRPIKDMIIVPWSQLTNLVVDQVLPAHQYLDVFRQCTALVTASLFGIDVGEASPTEIVKFSSLQHLEYRLSVWPTALFHIGDFPALRILTLEPPCNCPRRWNWGLDREDLLDVAHRLPALCKITIRRADTRRVEGDIMDFLKALPATLDYLRLDRCRVRKDLFTRLRVHAGDEAPALPHLTTLSLVDTYLDEFLPADSRAAEEELYQLVESRIYSAQVEHLRNFEFSYEGERTLDAGISARVRALASDSLVVRLAGGT